MCASKLTGNFSALHSSNENFVSNQFAHQYITQLHQILSIASSIP